MFGVLDGQKSPTEGQKDGWIDGMTYGWTDRQRDGKMFSCTAGWLGKGLMDRWMFSKYPN